jgi:RNA polymerase primary sigma factor
MLNMSVNDIEDTMSVSGRHVSVDAPFSDGEENSLLDLLENRDQPNPDQSLMSESLSREIDRALSTLTFREAEVIRAFFGLNGMAPLSLEEIGDKFDLTRERVRQIKEKSIRRLRQTNRSRSLKVYLG